MVDLDFLRYRYDAIRDGSCSGHTCRWAPGFGTERLHRHAVRVLPSVLRAPGGAWRDGARRWRPESRRDIPIHFSVPVSALRCRRKCDRILVEPSAARDWMARIC